jgi:division protein 1
LTGGSDGNVRLWDLRLVEDYEDKAARADVDVASRSPLDRQTAEPSTAANVRDGEEHPSDDAQKQDEGNPCVRTLEGHSKAVTALYYEEGCLVCWGYFLLVNNNNV